MKKYLNVQKQIKINIKGYVWHNNAKRIESEIGGTSRFCSLRKGLNALNQFIRTMNTLFEHHLLQQRQCTPLSVSCCTAVSTLLHSG